MAASAPETVFHGGRIYTVDSQFSIHNAVAIAGDRIVAVGNDDAIRRMADQHTLQLDLRGRTVIPGLIDSHNHMSTTGLGMLKPSLEGATAIPDIQSVIAQAAKSTPPGSWIVTATIGEPAISHNLAEERYPYRWELDAVSPDNPVCLPAPHVAIVNSQAIKLLGLEGAVVPPGGEIGTDAETGELDGRVYESAWKTLVEPFLPELKHADRVAGLKEACRRYNAVGITQINEHGIDWPTWEAYRQACEEGELTVRSNVHLRVAPGTRGSALDELAAEVAKRGREESQPPFLKLTGLKTFIDGGVGIGTALFHEPYTAADGQQSHGICLQTGDAFEEIVRACVRHGLQLSQHDSGDAAIDLVLDAYEAVHRDTPLDGRRFIMVHCQFPSSDAMRRISEFGALVAAQTVFLYSMGKGYIKYLGSRRAQGAMPIRDLLDYGITVGLGSDSSVNSYNPFIGLWHAEARKGSSTSEVIGGHQAIARGEALRCYTINNSRMSFDEGAVGSIEVGKFADLVVLPKDPLTCPLDEVPEIVPDATFVGGELVYGSI